LSHPLKEYVMPKAVICALAVVCGVLLATAASANQLDLFGLTTRATSLANTYTAMSEGAEAAFYNPGALIESRSVRAFLSYGFSIPAFSLDQTEDDGGNLADSPEIESARGVDPGQWLTMGVSGGIKDIVFLGMTLQVPIDGYARKKIFSPDHPYFLDYDTGIFGLTLVPAIGFQLSPNFGLGVGARVTLDSVGSFHTSIPTDVSRTTRSTTVSSGQISGQFAPIFGFYARSHEFLRFGLTYHGESYAYFHKTRREYVEPSEENGFVEVEYEARYNYIPRRITVAIVGQPDEHVMIAGEIVYVGWSSYRPPFPKLRYDYSAMAAAGIPYERAEPLQPKDADFIDIFVPRFAVEPRVNKYLAFRVGYSYEPSPVPEQEGTTTILDSPTHVVSLGAGANFAGKNGDLINLDFGVMDHILAEDTTTKLDAKLQDGDSPNKNPAWPRYVMSGHYVFGSLTASFKF
jgi:long-subunit fatty acid transport protein